MIVELMRPAGADLARRWLAALLVAPEEEREAIVASVEARLVELYASGAPVIEVKPNARASEPAR